MNSKIFYMKITREDINFLYYLYRFRCLSTRQVRSYFYDFSSYYKEKIVPMVSSQLIELKNNGTDYYVMITQKGIMLFQRYLNIPNEIYNAETGKNEKSVLRASEVVIEEKFVQHQLALNEFVLEFRKKQGDIDYYDEKYLSGMKIIRPDGLIKIGGTDILLEQDMGTESSKQLADK